MDLFQKSVQKAERSPFRLWLLNKMLHLKIPFNKPHGLTITQITPDGFEVLIPYTRRNHNHIRGIHACCLATASEYVCGLALLRKLGSEKYRLIMEKMEVRYKYQAKEPVSAFFEVTDAFLQEKVIGPLAGSDVVFVEFTTVIKNKQGQTISEADTRWQIKPWDKVRTKI